MLTTLEGRMGMGKTLVSVFMGVADQVRIGCKIFATFHLQNVYNCSVCGIPHKLVAFDDNDKDIVFTETVKSEEKELYEWAYSCNAKGTLFEFETISVEPNDPSIFWIDWQFLNLESFYEIFNRADEGIEILRNCRFLLDEAYLFMSSRNSSSKVNRLFTSFTFQSRKRGLDLVLATHSLGGLDKWVREAIDIRVTCRFNPATQTVKLRLRDMHTGERRTISVFGPAVYAYFDTHETVKPAGKLYRLKQSDVR